MDAPILQQEAVPRVGGLVEVVDHFHLEGVEEEDLQEVAVVEDLQEVVGEEAVHHLGEEVEEGHHHLAVVVEEEDPGLVGEEVEVGLLQGEEVAEVVVEHQ